MKRLYEKKDHLIKKNPNLTDGQKSEIIELLGRHPSYENKIDWNKSNSLTYEDFLKVLRPLYINELDPRGLVEGQDYDILYESNDEVLYSVYTYDASKILASNSVGPELWTRIPDWCGREEKTDEAHAFGHFDSEHGDMKPGAKWCISMQTSDRYWKKYSTDFFFFFWFRDRESLKNDRKIAIEVRKTTWQVAFLYNGADNEIGTPLPSYIMKAIENKKEASKGKKLNRIKFKLKLNPQANRYDCDGDLDIDKIKNFVSEDKDGFTIKFGKITGNFDCFNLGLKSLKGAPQTVGGDFNCASNQLTSLEEAPQDVGGHFDCFDNQLTSLKGAPQIVGGDFDCHSNQLTSLEGSPKEVGNLMDKTGNFNCTSNRLTSLEGAPQEVGGNFNCSKNHLTSLEGAPWKVGRNFRCSDNQLTSLKGAPAEVDGWFEGIRNKLTSLEGAPRKVVGDFACNNNPDLHSLDGIGEVGGKIYKDF